MRSPRSFIILLLLAAASSSAGVVEISVFAIATGRNQARLVSGDGYHYGSFKSSGEKASWSVDGRVLLEGPVGTVMDNSERYAGRYAALSADGRLLVSAERVAAPDGSRKYSLTLNGKRIGSLYDSITEVQVGRKGANVVFLARTSRGCLVVSAAGEGPPFPECPTHVVVSDSGVLYLGVWNNRTFLYRDLVPVAEKDYRGLAASSDFSRIAGQLDDGKAFHSVEIGDAVVVKQPSISRMMFSEGGKHFGVVAGENSSKPNKVIVAAKSYPLKSEISRIALRPSDGVPFVMGDDQHLYIAGIDKGELGEASTRGEQWIGFSPSGAHSAFLVHGFNPDSFQHLIVDGLLARDSVLSPLDGAGVVFDSENQFHYLGWRASDDKIYLVCGTVDGSSPKRTPCGAVGASRALHASQ